MTKYKLFILFILFSISISGLNLFAVTNESVIIHMQISNMKHAQAPVFLDRKIIFSYDQKKYVRRVGIAFGFENYRVVYPFYKNDNNVFVYISDIPQGMDSLSYRIIVDGLWINDPHNPSLTRSADGFLISSLAIPSSLKKRIQSPTIEADRTVTFIYTGKSNETIFLSGNFNNWDPFMLKLTEDKNDPGYYSISLRIPPGRHYYTFIANGKEITDPQNPYKAIDQNGRRVSLVDVP